MKSEVRSQRGGENENEDEHEDDSRETRMRALHLGLFEGGDPSFIVLLNRARYRGRARPRSLIVEGKNGSR
jgi:hypothetical protein